MHKRLAPAVLFYGHQLVRKARLELARLAALEPKSSASTNSATFANVPVYNIARRVSAPNIGRRVAVRGDDPGNTNFAHMAAPSHACRSLREFSRCLAHSSAAVALADRGDLSFRAHGGRYRRRRPRCGGCPPGPPGRLRAQSRCDRSGRNPRRRNIRPARARCARPRATDRVAA